MSRPVVLLIWLVLFALVPRPMPAGGQAIGDEQAAADAAVELSVYEATGDFNALYDRIHPDAHAVVPRAAAIGWFATEFAPRGPGVATVTGVRFVDWTWPVTGQTYPFTAEVSYEQPFADGTVEEDVVRLVQDRTGAWRWFFGRDRAFVDEQIARFSPPPPRSNLPAVEVAIRDVDDFWRVAFRGGGRAYPTPGVTGFDAPIATGCGPVDPQTAQALYCPLDGGIYYALPFFAALDASFGDFAPVNVLAHEWGHHVQFSLGIEPGPSNAFELQADCLAGSYARDAATRGLLNPGDVTEAVLTSASSGDDPVWPQDRPGAHGTGDDRIAAFMRGYLDGFLGCALPIAAGSAGETVVGAPDETTDLLDALPSAAEAPAGLEVVGERRRTLAEVAGNYAAPAATERRFADWGWAGNVVRDFGPAAGVRLTSGATASLYVSVHRFGDAAAAAEALDYSVADQAATTDAEEVRVGPIGERSRALVERGADGNAATVYAQRGAVLVRATATSPAGDPMADARAAAQTVVERVG